MNGLFRENKYYVEYEAHQRHLHELIANGLGDDEEADAVRDCMDTPWYKLTQEETERLGGLSADLYMLQDDEIFQPSDGRTKIQIGQAVYAAMDQERWAEALNLMRQPNMLPRVQVAQWRSAAYNALDHLEAALLFLRYAIKLAPEHSYKNLFFKAVELTLLKRCNRQNEARQIAEAYTRDVTVPPFLQIVAITFIVINFEDENDFRYDDIVPVLEQALQMEAPVTSHRRETMALGYEVLGLCYFRLEMVQQAYDAIAEALRLSPSEPLSPLLDSLRQLLAGSKGATLEYKQLITRELQTSLRTAYSDKYVLAAA